MVCGVIDMRSNPDSLRLVYEIADYCVDDRAVCTLSVLCVVV